MLPAAIFLSPKLEVIIFLQSTAIYIADLETIEELQ
jgi:hypothetical protein